ncbi:EAL domain-containing protein [Candidatus Woesebacteria bacterium]|nr:EAL domain-containing protein [Candidatus Woesebacteria bacterium]
MINPESISKQELVLEEQSRAIFESAADSMMVLSQEGVVLAVNSATSKIFGFSRLELIGQNISMLVPELRSPLDDEMNSHRIFKKPQEATGLKKNGAHIPLHLSFGELLINGQSLFVGIVHDASPQKKVINQITYLAAHDSLTGCLNRNYLHENLQKLLVECKQNNLQLAVIYIDLDDFKYINDRYDHHIGDSLLKCLAKRVRENLNDRDLFSRLGGDEFLVASIQPRERSAPRKLAQSILDSLEQPFEFDQIEIKISASIGISLSPGCSISSDQLVNDADIAMYQAKADGGNCVRFFQLSMREKIDTIFETVGRLRKAIELDQFELHYQLQFELNPPYRPSGLEALLRWRDHEGNYISPENFIPLAEEYGLMPAISRWVLDRACADNMALISSGLLDVPVAINICSQSFVQAEFVNHAADTLSRVGLPNKRLEIEVTESIAIHDISLTKSTIDALHHLGVEVSIDDFGTGYSSLILLKILPVDRLKIDRAFVSELPHNTFDQAIIKAILILAKSKNIQVVAEGIENIEQLQFLHEHGCNHGQGFWYAEPLPLSSLVMFLNCSQND